jgi:hypothetical protein
MLFTTKLLSRRTAPFLVKRSKIKVEERAVTSIDTIAPITGDIDKDGLNRYELDFMEQATVVKELLLKLQKDQFQPKKFEKKGSICLQVNSSFEFDKKSTEKSYLLHVPLDALSIDKKQRHSLILLVGKRFDPYTNSFTLQGNSKPELQEILDKLLTESTRDLSDIRVDLRHVRIRKTLDFPVQWIPK